MPIIRLQLWDQRQADELRNELRRLLPNAFVQEGTHDAFGGEMAADNHLTIDYHDEQLIEHALREYFEPRGHNWQEFRKA